MDFENAKRIWRHTGNGFALELVNWRLRTGDPEKWNIYVYVYPEHRWYKDNIALFDGTYRSLDPVPPFHGGISKMEMHQGSIELGCDYQHDGDEFYSIEIDPYTFEYDINKLIRWFDDYNQNGQAISVEPSPTPTDNKGYGLFLEDLYQNNSEVC